MRFTLIPDVQRICSYAWAAYKESGLAARTIWFILIMGLGNIATAAYVLLQLGRLQPGDSWESLLLRRTARPGRWRRG